MSNPYVGEIRIFAGNYAPVNWAFCDGSLMSIADNPTLFNLIGTTYGGDGDNTFGLPDLRSRVPVHQGNNQGNPYVTGQNGGLESVSLTAAQLPVHSHLPGASVGASTAAANTPLGNTWASWSGGQYSATTPTVAMSPAAVGNAGNSVPHDNMIPYLAVNFIISLFGIYPSQN